jgi:hypothetical protein
MQPTTTQRQRTKPRGRLALTAAAALAGALIASLVGPWSAAAGGGSGGAGFDGPSRALESAFKIALLERRETPDGCYPAPGALAETLRQTTTLRVSVKPSLKSVKKRGIAYVIIRGAGCNRAIMALRGKRGLYVLDSRQGPIYVIGPGGKRLKGKDAIVGGAGPLRSLSLRSKTFSMTSGNEVRRLTVLCSGKRYPIGGGMIGSPGPSAEREGVYPHSYERLGVQRGWHINPVLIDPDLTGTTPRQVTLQVMCGRGLVPHSSPHKTVFVRPGETKSAVARCPKRTKVFSGGFQRADFRTPSGSFPIESRAVGARSWRVTGRAFGAFGGEITAIAYCSRDKEAKVKTVKRTTSIAFNQFSEATTPRCPRGRRLIAGGFSANGTTGAFSDGGHFNNNGTWTAGAFGFFGPAPSYTAYGYCART